MIVAELSPEGIRAVLGVFLDAYNESRCSAYALTLIEPPADLSCDYVFEDPARPGEPLKVQLMRPTLTERAMVFVHRNETAENVAARLAHHRVPVADLHAAAYKRDRKKAMDEFRSAQVHVLIVSDVAARGLDIKGVTHVFNLDVPTQSKAYLHRVGRTAQRRRQWAGSHADDRRRGPAGTPL